MEQDVEPDFRKLLKGLERDGDRTRNVHLGKRSKIVSQGFWRFLKAILCTVFTEFPQFDREWNHSGITTGNFTSSLCQA